jgi:iron(III) transport system ATP-binding protein
LRAEIRDMALDALRDAGAAALIVTHDAEDALLTADRLALMQDGRILQAGTPEEVYARPVSLAAARLTGDADALPALVTGGSARTAYGQVPAPGRPDGPALVMARPEAFRPDEERPGGSDRPAPLRRRRAAPDADVAGRARPRPLALHVGGGGDGAGAPRPPLLRGLRRLGW